MSLRAPVVITGASPLFLTMRMPSEIKAMPSEHCFAKIKVMREQWQGGDRGSNANKKARQNLLRTKLLTLTKNLL